jgi:hypothetical protein
METTNNGNNLGYRDEARKFDEVIPSDPMFKDALAR